MTFSNENLNITLHKLVLSGLNLWINIDGLKQQTKSMQIDLKLLVGQYNDRNKK